MNQQDHDQCDRRGEVVSAFGYATDHVEDAFGSIVPGFPLPRLALELRDLRSLASRLKIMEDELSSMIIPHIEGHVSVEVEGVGVVQAKKSSERKAWDHEELIRIVVARGRDERKIDPETGEALESEVEAVVRALSACAGIRDWKVTGLRARGIDPDEFCAKSWGPKKVIL